jgi:DeoR family fructose operon transcriptional repressor
MLAAKRQETILSLLDRDRFVKVADLAQMLEVTEKTIREDLEKLEAKGLLRRIRGGAVLRADDGEERLFPIKIPNTRALDEKKYIADLAIQYIEPGDIIALDAGSTTLEIARALPNMQVTVVTNDLYIIHELINKNEVRLAIPGGYRQQNLLIGSESLDFIRKLNIHKTFISATGVHLEYGLSIFNEALLEQKKSLIECAREVYCVADHNKMEKSALFTFAKLSDIDMILTDTGLDTAVATKYADAGIQLKYLR